jgi:antiviral helicase SKI2
MKLQNEIAKLKFELSDQNLELLPDYEQRIQVLKDLRLIDENQTVLLKGRVACEVCPAPFTAYDSASYQPSRRSIRSMNLS